MIEKTLFLCPDCAALYAESYTVDTLPDRPAAAVCDCCWQRRLGYKYRVRGKGDKP